jgi:hypothetical protein
MIYNSEKYGLLIGGGGQRRDGIKNMVFQSTPHI